MVDIFYYIFVLKISDNYTIERYSRWYLIREDVKVLNALIFFKTSPVIKPQALFLLVCKSNLHSR